jgi:hypothetical protein
VWFFALFDQRGQAQRIAQTASASDARQFEGAGFTEIDEATFDSLVDLVPIATVGSLGLLTAAATALTNILDNTGARREQRRQVRMNRGMLSRLRDATEADLDAITQEYLDGRINIRQWQRRMQDRINSANFASRIASKSGLQDMTQADLQAVERANATQARYLAKFRRELEAGQLTDAQARARARMYKGTVTPVYEEGLTDAVGLPTLPAYPAVRTECKSNCKCQWDIQPRPGNGNWDCYWRLAPAEHCPTCLARRRAFNPLRIRGGVIQPYNPTGIFE